jgi:hypothetical protein
MSARAAPRRRPKETTSGQREMLIAISGKGQGKSAKQSKRPARLHKIS